jgi:hypothetical protein
LAIGADFRLLNEPSVRQHMLAFRTSRACLRAAGTRKFRRKPVTRPRAADDFATIYARLVELRREREQASKQDGAGDDAPSRSERTLLGSAEGRQRLEKNGWLTVSAGRRYGPGRSR